MSAPADQKPKAPRPPTRRMRGFEAAGGLLRENIRKAGESRGFAVARLLTHWTEIAGPDLAAMCRPVKVGYAQGGLGATLTVAASGAAAPLVQMQLERLRDKVNAIYGYAAIARIRLTQSAGPGLTSGLAEAQTPFLHSNIAPPSAQAIERARGVVTGLTDGVADSGLKEALERLATEVLMKQTRRGPAGPRNG